MSVLAHGTRLVGRRASGFWSIATIALSVAGSLASGAQPIAGQSEGAQSTDSLQQSQATDPPLRVGEIVSVTATLAGARDTVYTGSTQAGNVQPGGGCRSDQMLRMGFTFFPPDHSTESWVRWEVGAPMEPGATGTFSVESVSYWYPALGVPSRSSFQGAGSLEVTRHDARPGARRMAGRLVAQGLEGPDGQLVDVDVSFDMGGSCGTLN